MPGNYTILAPYPATLATNILPNPQWGDVEKKTATVIIHRAMDGTAYSTIRNQTTRQYSWSFDLPRVKGLEFLKFWELYNAEVWQILRSNDTLIGNIQLNPATIDMLRRSVNCESKEAVSLNFDFETVQ